MKHPEVLFLLHRAHVLQRQHRKAEAEGEVFHPTDSYVPLESGVEAACDIRRLNKTDPGDHTILRLRHSPKITCEVAAAEAAIFFEGLPPPGFVTSDGVGCLHVHAHPTTLKAVTFDDDPDLATAADAPKPGGPTPDR